MHILLYLVAIMLGFMCGVLRTTEPEIVDAGLAYQEPPCSAPGVSNQYDALYREGVRQYYPTTFQNEDEWCWLKAQALTESGQNPDAVSPAGAISILQVMPDTAQEIYEKVDISGELTDPHTNIELGAFYMGDRLSVFYEGDEDCIREKAQAAYNGGTSRVVNAQVEAGGGECVEEFAEHLPEETREYPVKIEDWHQRLTANWFGNTLS